MKDYKTIQMFIVVFKVNPLDLNLLCYTFLKFHLI